MYHNRFALVLCVFLLVAGLPTPALAATSPSLPKQAAPLVETLSTGAFFACQVKSNGDIKCWGADGQGQSTPPTGVFTQVSASWGYACALKSDGTVACWGANSFGGTNPPADTFTQVSLGNAHSCGLKNDGSIVCWGAGKTKTGTYPEFGQSIVPDGSFTQISAGSNHTCGLQSNGTILCWGAGTTNTGSYPEFGQSMSPDGSFTQVSAGNDHTCGLQSNGTILCWGANDQGQSTPQNGVFTQVSAGSAYTCGLKSDGSIACWGNNGSGNLTPPDGVFSQVSVGVSSACGMNSTGSVRCWGSNTFGELNSIRLSGNAGMASTRMDYTGGTSPYTFADDNGDYVINLPYNWSGTVTPKLSLGQGGDAIFSPSNRTYADLTADQTGQDYIRAVVIGGNVSASGATLSYVDGTPKTVTADGDGNYSFAVPYNWSGVVTPSLTGFHFKPASRTYTTLITSQTYEHYIASSGVAFPQISAGGNQTCQLKSKGQVTCWGNDSNGQSVPLAGTFIQISVGGYHACGLRTNGTIACWGANYANQSTPPAGTFTQISAGEYYTCGLRTNGAVVCWGDKFDKLPKPPAGTFTQISAGNHDVCGIKSNGKVACWGNSYTSVTAPDGIFTDISVKGSGCALKSDGTVFCWPQYTIAPLNGTFTQISQGQGYICGLKSDRTLACAAYQNQSGQVKPPPGTFIQFSVGDGHGCGLKSDERVVCWGSNHYAQLEPSKLSFVSDGSLDGYVLESTETSGIGGSFNASDRTFPIGDDAANRQYRVILSFPTNFIPDSAIVKSAVVKIMREGLKGSNPFNVLGNLLIDIRKGPFGGNSALQAVDFKAAASATKVGTFNKIPAANWYTAILNAAGLSQISKTNSTQLRLYFSHDDNNNHMSDSMNFLSGSAASSSGSLDVRPILIIQYALP